MDYFFNFDPDTLYTRILLFSWDCYLSPVQLSETNGEFLSAKLDEKKIESQQKIFINCNHVLDIEDHFHDKVKELAEAKKSNFTLIFYSNDGRHALVNYLAEHWKSDEILTTNYITEKTTHIYVISKKNTMTNKDCMSYIDEVEKLELSKIKKIIGDTYHDNATDQELSSTSLKASGQFNAAYIISNPDYFKWIIILLFEKIINISKSEKLTGYTLIASSLRGGVIAGGVWELLKSFDDSINLNIVDHVGPCHDVRGNNNVFMTPIGRKCIYIGDFMIAGTEIKLTSVYCNFIYSKLIHAFVIGKYSRLEIINDIKLHCLINLQECDIDNLKYELI